MKDEVQRFPPIRFEKERPVPKHIAHKDRVQTINVDAAALAAALSREIRGEVRFDNGSRALYATDASNYRQVPIGVVMPRDAGDVIATVALARKFGAPILARGGGTSLAGQCCNVAVVMDFSKYMHHITEMDAKQRYARVEPGIVLDDLREAAEQQIGRASCRERVRMWGGCVAVEKNDAKDIIAELRWMLYGSGV